MGIQSWSIIQPSNCQVGRKVVPLVVRVPEFGPQQPHKSQEWWHMHLIPVLVVGDPGSVWSVSELRYDERPCLKEQDGEQARKDI